jgi:hypothetical protein
MLAAARPFLPHQFQLEEIYPNRGFTILNG